MVATSLVLPSTLVLIPVPSINTWQLLKWSLIFNLIYLKPWSFPTPTCNSSSKTENAVSLRVHMSRTFLSGLFISHVLQCSLGSKLSNFFPGIQAACRLLLQAGKGRFLSVYLNPVVGSAAAASSWGTQCPLWQLCHWMRGKCDHSPLFSLGRKCWIWILLCIKLWEFSI